MAASITLAPPPGFNLIGASTAHGWYQLAPWTLDRERGTLSRPFELDDKLVSVHIHQEGERLIIAADRDLPAHQASELAGHVRWCLRLDEDLSEFHALCEVDPALRAAVTPSGGRLLRSPTLWEDVVKTILTTNTTWAQTKAMAARLVAALGTAAQGESERRGFPSPQAAAEAGEARFATEIRLGYRNAPVLRIARDIAEGRLDLESLRCSELPPPALHTRLVALPGVGPYSAATLLMLLGRYDELAVDTELRAHVSRKYFSGERVTEKQMRGVYDHWGRWRYLAYWFDPRE